MNKLWIIAITTVLVSCNGTTPSQPPHPIGQSLSHIVVHVWGGEGEGKLIELAETGDTLRTDSTSTARFNVPAGHYTVFAFGLIMPGGSDVDETTVDTHAGDTTRVNFYNCIPCLRDRESSSPL